MKRRLFVPVLVCCVVGGVLYFLSRPAEKPDGTSSYSLNSTINPELMNACQLAFPTGKRGAIVVIDPRNGHVLADYSTPDLTAGDELGLSEIPTSPAMTIFPVIALAGSPTNIDERTFDCGGGRKFGSKFMKCWIVNRPERSHGELDLAGGLLNSCNGYFYRYATEVGISDILITAEHFGISRKSRLAARHRSVIPDPEWLKWQGMQWSPAFTALVAIGQGATEISPLQMALVYSAIANGGVAYEANWDPAMNSTILTNFKTLPQYKQTTIEKIRQGLHANVNDPGAIGSNAKSNEVVIAGQTGTAQTGNPKKPVNAWFCGFAPFENPTVAIAVFVKDGTSGNSTAAPVAKEVLEFALKNTPPNS